jgi:hypothetical protein
MQVVKKKNGVIKMFTYKYPNFWKLQHIDRLQFMDTIKNIVDDSYYTKSNKVKRKITISEQTFMVSIDKKNYIVEVS